MVGLARGDQAKISAKIPEPTMDELRILAARNRRSIAAEVRIAIHNMLIESGYIDA